MEEQHPLVLELQPFDGVHLPHCKFMTGQCTVTYDEMFAIQYIGHYTVTCLYNPITHFVSIYCEVQGIKLKYEDYILTITAANGKTQQYNLSIKKEFDLSSIFPIRIQYEDDKYIIYYGKEKIITLIYNRKSLYFINIQSYGITIDNDVKLEYYFPEVDMSVKNDTYAPLVSFDIRKITIHYVYPQFFTEYHNPVFNIEFYKDHISVVEEHSLSGLPYSSNEFIIYNDRVTLSMMVNNKYLKLEYERYDNFYTLYSINDVSREIPDIVRNVLTKDKFNYDIPMDINRLSYTYPTIYISLLSMLV